MAEVQLALQRGPAGFEKLVVVKLVHENLAAQKDFVEMLLDEARVAALLKHPNVVDIYDLGQVDGRFFIAMEYLEGEPLLAVLRAGREGTRLDPLSTARLIADTAEGLDAAHELRSMGGEPLELVHHDVSLGNIVVLYNGQVKLVDFGVAKATQSVAPARRVQGKFSYMAPEKLRGGAGDRRSDIWSLGCVLWESLTLKRLFKGGNDSDTMRQVLESEIPPPSKINSDLLPAFDVIVMRALQRDPEQRYPTAKEMANDLEELLRQQGYGGKNDRIAKYMQATFKAHIDARKQLLQEVSSKGGASADVLEAAFDDPMLASGSPVLHPGDFSGRFKTSTIPNVVEVRPQTGRPARLDLTPTRRPSEPSTPPATLPLHLDYPRAMPSDLPPTVARPPDEDEENAATVLSPPLEALEGPAAGGAVRRARAGEATAGVPRGRRRRRRGRDRRAPARERRRRLGCARPGRWYPAGHRRRGHGAGCSRGRAGRDRGRRRLARGLRRRRQRRWDRREGLRGRGICRSVRSLTPGFDRDAARARGLGLRCQAAFEAVRSGRAVPQRDQRVRRR